MPEWKPLAGIRILASNKNTLSNGKNILRYRFWPINNELNGEI
jgi:hypothetical protein